MTLATQFNDTPTEKLIPDWYLACREVDLCASHRIGLATGLPVISTDMLGRHPERPWTGVPDAVVEFYHRLSNDTIHWFLRAHHKNMRPIIREKIRAQRQMGDGFIFESAALRPEYLADWEIGDALVVCFHVEDPVLRERIVHGSRYSEQGKQVKAAIEKFVERSLCENTALAEAAKAHGAPRIDVTNPENADRSTKELVSRLVGSSDPS
ncbi:hypothetical protein FXV83_41045 [Bradyrhizobium hipponense]|uniref:Uncharacterized protein n=1 Tax=Bradyrhizobium hipponense TaxID=2605638 RepID=A0A5S4Y907_9BRAD|nr:hypothetical protein [Bradyrhizobium hipponense]TYO60921.1 hypothetical protein FXV83_41045 [Bradyrhizobium hipponense]